MRRVAPTLNMGSLRQKLQHTLERAIEPTHHMLRLRMAASEQVSVKDRRRAYF